MEECKTKKKLSPWQIVCIVFSALAVLVAIILLGARAYFRLSVSDYYRASEKTFEIAGLSDGFVPQGMDFDERSGCFFVTGYMDDGSASPIYLIEKESGELKKTLCLATEEGEAFDGHAGGLSVHGSYIYVAGGGDRCLYVYSYDHVMAAKDGDAISCLGEFSTKIGGEDSIRVSFTATDEERIYVGEFYREDNYSTPESHKLTTENGDYHQALCVAYAFSDDADAVFGIKSEPLFAYSLTDAVQGMCFREGEVYLSTSYGLSFSGIYGYDTSKLTEKEITLSGVTMPLYSLDSAALIKSIKAAPMSEEIEFVDGKLYTMCESASNKYIFGKFTSSKWCYATDVDAYGK